jgi:hypothetical protein
MPMSDLDCFARQLNACFDRIDACFDRIDARCDRIEELLGRIEKVLARQSGGDPDGALAPIRPAGVAAENAAASLRRGYRDAALIEALRFT